METRLLEYIPKIIIPAIFETLKMLSFSFLTSVLLGGLVSVVLVYSHPFKGLKPNKVLYNVIDIMLNLLRAFPVIILIVAITPLTKIIVGTSIGSTAAIVPITLATAPFVAKNLENVMLEVYYNKIIAAKSFGASNFQILREVLFLESLPSVISTLTTISIMTLGTTAIAGAIGAGGLGSVALNYGYQRFDNAVMYTIVVILALIVTIIQLLGNFIYRKADK